MQRFQLESSLLRGGDMKGSECAEGGEEAEIGLAALILTASEIQLEISYLVVESVGFKEREGGGEVAFRKTKAREARDRLPDESVPISTHSRC